MGMFNTSIKVRFICPELVFLNKKKYSKRLFLSHSVKTINYVLHLDKFNDEKIKKIIINYF